VFDHGNSLIGPIAATMVLVACPHITRHLKVLLLLPPLLLLLLLCVLARRASSAHQYAFLHLLSSFFHVAFLLEP
jgi:hypothetical protein